MHTKLMTLAGIALMAAACTHPLDVKTINPTALDMANDKRQMVLETALSATKTEWSHTGDITTTGTITPNKTYRLKNGQYCRRITETITTPKTKTDPKRQVTVVSDWCRNTDGKWAIYQK